MNSIKKYSSANEAYKDIAFDLLNNGHDSHGTKELYNYSFTLTNLDNNIISCVPVNYLYMMGELLWYALADESIDFISRFKSTGMNRTSETPWSNSAYGHILAKRHGFNQIDQVVEALSKNPDSRRAIINLNVPDRNRLIRKDEICTIALQFYINDGKLNQTAIMRSNDAYGCLPYDLAFFTELQKLIAKRIGCEVGEYTHFAVSFHTYERDWSKIEPIAANPPSVKVDFEKLYNEADNLKKALFENNFDNEEQLMLFQKVGCIFSDTELI